MKKCTACGEEKTLSSFYYNRIKKRHVAECLLCSSARKKEYSKRNAEKLKAANRKWVAANQDKVIAAQDRWRAKNPGLAAARTAKWRSENRERALEAQKLANRKLKDAAYAAYGGYRCKCCGETREAFLSIDHVNNDGAEHRTSMPHRQIYKWLQKNDYPEGFQILCMNCNFGKARNGGVCPHQEERPEGSSTIQRWSRAKQLEARGPSDVLGEDIVRTRR